MTRHLHSLGGVFVANVGRAGLSESFDRRAPRLGSRRYVRITPPSSIPLDMPDSLKRCVRTVLQADAHMPGTRPPDPRSFPFPQHPAEVQGQESDRAEQDSARSSAVTLANGRSEQPMVAARIPVESYPPAWKKKHHQKGPDRPSADHPWRRQFQWNQPDISKVEK